MLPLNDILPFNVVGESSVVSFSAFWVTAAALGATVLTAWGGYGKNSDTGLSLKRVGPLPAVKVAYLLCFASDQAMARTQTPVSPSRGLALCLLSR